MGKWIVGALCLMLFVTGVLQPIVIEWIHYAGAGEPSTVLFMVPNYVGMALMLLIPSKWVSSKADMERKAIPNCWRRILTLPRWAKILCVGFLDVFSFCGVFIGMTLAGSSIYTILYSSVTVVTALFARFLLGRHLSLLQWLSCAIVTFGLALSAIGTRRYGQSVVVGAFVVLLSTLVHALFYVTNEAVMSCGERMAPVPLAGWVGVIGMVLLGMWQVIWTIPRWDVLVVDPMEKQQTSTGLWIGLYSAAIVVDGLHGTTFFVLMGKIGAVATGVLQGLITIAVFAFSSVAFCSIQPSQCFTLFKGLGLGCVIVGCLLYSYATSKKKKAKRMEEEEGLLEDK